MKTKITVVNKRRIDILEYIKEKKEANVFDLSEIFQVSELTIRRDLDYLESKDLIRRFHGGARVINKVIHSNFKKEDKHINLIAERAVDFIENGDILFINSSYTAILVIKYLRDKKVTIITNNAKVLNFNHDPKVTVVLTGGTVGFPKESLTGEFATSNLSKVKATKSIIGVSGLEKGVGITSSNLDEVAINQLMLSEQIKKRIVVADSSKINHVDAYISGQLEQISILITDSNADREFIKYLKSIGIEVILI